MLIVRYKIDGCARDSIEFNRGYEEFVEWLHKQLLIGPITILSIEE